MLNVSKLGRACYNRPTEKHIKNGMKSIFLRILFSVDFAQSICDPVMVNIKFGNITLLVNISIFPQLKRSNSQNIFQCACSVRSEKNERCTLNKATRKLIGSKIVGQFQQSEISQLFTF